jgi:hypothetical protein
MNGLAEYLPIPSCPYPDIVSQWEVIPAAQVAGFTPEGFKTGDCFAGLGDYLTAWDFLVPQRINAQGTGLGAIALISPDGYFQGGPSAWGVAEWGSILGGIYVAGSAWGDTKRLATKAKKVGGKARKKAKSGVSGLGVLTLVAAAGAGLYFMSQANAGAPAQ